MLSTLRFLPWLLVAIHLVSVSSAQEPAQATPLRREGPRVPPGVKVLRDLEYVKGGSKSRSLDLYLPDAAGAPRPLIVWIHGGAWRGGTKAGNPALWLMKDGFVTASVEYRMSQEAIFPAQIEDCKAAIRFLRANAREYGIDPERIGVWGSSAGGHLVALLGTANDAKDFEKGEQLEVSSRVQAVCDWFGPANLLTMGAQSGPDSRLRHDAPDSPESLLVGGPVQELKDKARGASPLAYVSKGDAPFLIMHGDKDPVVPFAQSQDLYAALQNEGVESQLHVIAGGGHGGQGFNTPEVQEMIRVFFTRHLLGNARQ